MSEIHNHLDLYRRLCELGSLKEQLAEYARLAPTLKFQVKSFGWIMKKGDEYVALNGEQ